ncbi:hypothetical protein CEXT_773521 [Caerostris extrusa]|uniref:Secreted protein n=1 Tax=Caerostris extrusa TaxID=172846 RepID=A0AAV4PDG3_CAEEX|nr:hypothetical protein CEXT_773521 [Caerostris extrusa]
MKHLYFITEPPVTVFISTLNCCTALPCLFIFCIHPSDLICPLQKNAVSCSLGMGENIPGVKYSDRYTKSSKRISLSPQMRSSTFRER